MISKTLALIATAATVVLGPDPVVPCAGAGRPSGSAEGTVVLVSAPVAEGGETAMTLFVDQQSRSQDTDGIADRVFRLQMEGSVDRRGRWTGVRVEWSPGRVAVTDESGRLLALTVGHWTRPASAEEFAGYGLSHATGWRAVLPTGEPSDAAYAVLAGLATPSEDDCSNPGDSGGEGATRCEVGCARGGSCSVTCGGEYSPCCKCQAGGAECRCTKKEPSQ